jgi:hypothetical protein
MTGQASLDEWKTWKASLKEELALVTGRNRITPTTTAAKKVTPDDSQDYVAADTRNFRRIRPSAPGGGGQGSDRTTSES